MDKIGKGIVKKNWRVLPLSEIAEEINDSYNPTKEENLSYIGLEHIEQQTLKLSGIGRSDIVISTKEKFQSGDILFGSLRPYFRKVVRPKFSGVCSTDITVIRAKRNYYQGFVFYLIASKEIIDYATNISNGTRMPRANWGVLAKSKWRIPPLPIQRKIADILSTYDDLIEINEQRIKILEEMARLIYKEWFVKFKFPGNEKVKMVKSELGIIPEGWGVVKICDRFTTVLGGTPSRNKLEYWKNGTIPWINSGKVNDLRVINESEFITELGFGNSSSKMMPKRTTILAITGATLGQVSLLEIKVCANQSVIGIYDNDKLFNEYIYLTFCEIIQTIIMQAGGGAQQHINKEIVNGVKVILPHFDIIRKFNETIYPIFDLIANLLFKNLILRQARDMLLPKLISGEIEVLI